MKKVATQDCVVVLLWKFFQLLSSVWRAHDICSSSLAQLCVPQVFPYLWCKLGDPGNVRRPRRGIHNLAHRRCSAVGRLSLMGKLDENYRSFGASVNLAPFQPCVAPCVDIRESRRDQCSDRHCRHCDKVTVSTLLSHSAT